MNSQASNVQINQIKNIPTIGKLDKELNAKLSMTKITVTTLVN